MKHKQVGKLVFALYVIAIGLYASHSLANPYGNQSQRSYNQGYGDFPPASIDQQLQGDPNKGVQLVEPPTQNHRATNPWRNQEQSAPSSTQNYPPQNYSGNYPALNYQVPQFQDSRNPGLLNQGPYYGASPYVSPGQNFGPWGNRGSGFSPWGSRGGRNPFGYRGPEDWFDPNKDSLSRNWDDMLKAPSRMGEMPGGWTAPSVTAPNPVDVGEEFGDAARDAPDQMDNLNWNNNRGRRY